MARRIPENELSLKVGVFTPETIPMARQAEYIAAFAQLLGEKEGIHFVKVRRGSNIIVARADKPVVQRVVARLKTVASMGDQDDGYKKIRLMLRADASPGTINAGKAKVLHFPKPLLQERVGPVEQEDYLDGQIVRIGGFDDTIPVHIRERDGTRRFCTTDVRTAKELMPYYLGDPVRLMGKAQWFREPDGQWKLPEFVITHFAPLDGKSPHAPAAAVVPTRTQ